jgi:hypothetical protein
MGPITFDEEVHWSGFVLSLWANRGDERILGQVERSTINELKDFKHATAPNIRESARQIAATLQPIFAKKIEAGGVVLNDWRQKAVTLRISDVYGL